MKAITPHGPLDCRIAVPGSKSLTQRALIAAALAEGESWLIGPLASEDTEYTSAALRQMGIVIEASGPDWRINGQGGRIVAPRDAIFLGNNGTATRFLTSVAALSQGEIAIGGGPRMAERPIQPLIDALTGWGVEIESVNRTGCPPLRLAASGLKGGHTMLPEGKSSQYLSSLLLVAPYAKRPASLSVRGEVLSKPYVVMTLAVMAAFGVKATASRGLDEFSIPQGRYRGRKYRIEGDASSASYFWAAAAVTGGRVTVENVPEPSLQGDSALVGMLAQMGCRVEKTATGITVTGPPRLTAIEVDMGDCPDVAPTLAVVAAFAQGETRINNIAHLRIKECDRLHVMATELAKLGVKTRELPGALIIEGDPSRKSLAGAEIDPHDDHRIAMCFAVAGLAVAGVTVRDEGCVAKSFPDFWERFSLLR